MTNNKPTLSEIRRAAGSKGGRATVAKYGPDHMRKIGQKGAQVTHSKYNLEPYGTSRFCFVDRKTRKIKAIW